MSVLFKLKKRASASAKQEVTRALEKLKTSARRLVEADEADELANVFSIDVPASRERNVISQLSQMAAVEYAEAAPRRRVM